MVLRYTIAGLLPAAGLPERWPGQPGAQSASGARRLQSFTELAGSLRAGSTDLRFGNRFAADLEYLALRRRSQPADALHPELQSQPAARTEAGDGAPVRLCRLPRNQTLQSPGYQPGCPW